MTINEAYMLQRDAGESRRLDRQHEFMTALAGGRLIHASIPGKDLRAIADVGTGTGIWLRDVATSLAASNPGQDGERVLVGFDISPEQFPQTEGLPPGMKFITHDATEPFPVDYHETFDLVHVRLLSYAIKAHDLMNVVRNVVQILRPGGFLQWQECDAIDTHISPETPKARATIKAIVSERVARGLTPASVVPSSELGAFLTDLSFRIATPLARMIQSLSAPIPDGQFNAVSWSDDLMRIMHLESATTQNHPSPAIEASKKGAAMLAAVPLLQAGVNRRKARLADSLTPSLEAEKLIKEAEATTELIEAIKRGEDPACNTWDFFMTWIVAKKAIIIDRDEA